MPKKPNKREILMREMACLENIGMGKVKDENIEDLKERFNIVQETAEKVYFETTRKVAGLKETSMEELKAQILCQMDVLYKKTMNEKKYMTALNVLQSKAKISGLSDADKDKKKKEKDQQLPKIIEVKEKDFG